MRNGRAHAIAAAALLGALSWNCAAPAAEGESAEGGAGGDGGRGGDGGAGSGGSAGGGGGAGAVGADGGGAGSGGGGTGGSACPPWPEGRYLDASLNLYTDSAPSAGSVELAGLVDAIGTDVQPPFPAFHVIVGGLGEEGRTARFVDEGTGAVSVLRWDVEGSPELAVGDRVIVRGKRFEDQACEEDGCSAGSAELWIEGPVGLIAWGAYDDPVDVDAPGNVRFAAGAPLCAGVPSHGCAVDYFELVATAPGAPSQPVAESFVAAGYRFRVAPWVSLAPRDCHAFGTRTTLSAVPLP